MNESVEAALKKYLAHLDENIDWKRKELSSVTTRSESLGREVDGLVRERREILDHLEVHGKPEPRVWDSLSEVPKDVAVHGSTGVYWSFWTHGRAVLEGKPLVIGPTNPGEWLWSASKSRDGFIWIKLGPFTEVVE
jgi:hypothetical protein